MDDSDDLDGECPQCAAEVEYGEWIAVGDCIGCPCCGWVGEVDDVYPEA
jgi:hypothetical protein